MLILTERGPMPLISLIVAVLTLAAILFVRPDTFRLYGLVMAFCLIPILAGAVGTLMGMHAVESGWQEFLAHDPSPEIIEDARDAVTSGKLAARDPLIFGIALSLPLMILNTIIFMIRSEAR